MATKKVLVEINVEQKGNSISKTTKEVDKLTAATEKLANEQKQEAVELAKVNYQIQQQQKANKIFAKEQVDLANAVENTTDKMQEMKTTSGLTGAIVTELGRTASDSAYGIRGMGNNISQLVTLFGQLSTNVQKAGGTMKDAFNQVFQSMKGVIGVMTALQIILGVLQTEWFQKWVEGLLRMTGLLDIFSTELSKLKNGIAGVTDEFGGLITELEVYTDILEDSTRSIEDKEIAYRKLIKQFPEMEDAVKRVGDEFVVSAEAVDAMKESLEELAISSAALDRLKEISAEKLKIDLEQRLANDELNTTLDSQIEKLKDMGVLNNRSAGQLRYYREQIEDVTTSEEDRYIAMVRSSEILEKSQEIAKIGSSTAEEYEASINDLRLATEDYAEVNADNIKNSEKEIELLKEYIKLDDKQLENEKKRSSSSNDKFFKSKDFKAGLTFLGQARAKFEQELVNLSKRTLEKQIEDERIGSAKSIAIKIDEFQIRQKIRLEDFKKAEKLRLQTFLSDKNLSEEQISAARETSRLNIENAEEEYKRSIELVNKEATETINALNLVFDERQVLRKQQQELRLQEREDEAQELEQEINLSRQVNVVDTAIQQGELDMMILENKENQLNAELELETENTEKRKELIHQLALLEMQQQDQSYVNAENVSNAKLALATRGANVLAEILGKETAAGKAVAATSATINTYEAVSNSLKYGTSPYKFIDAGITAAMGFQQVRNILSTDSPNTGSTSAGSNVTVQPPDFNIVGSTGVNQLADAIGSTEQQPVKAYVVASDVTTQQALDRNNRSNAEL